MRNDNGEGAVLYSLEDRATHASVLEVPPGASREIDAELTAFSDEKPVAAGDRVIATVPVGARSVRVTFIAAKPALLPF